MRLPKGASYRLVSTKGISLRALLQELSSQSFTGYLRITVEDEGLEDGYLLVKNGSVIGAEYAGRETLVSAAAYEKIKDAWRKEGIVDIYSFTEFQMQLAVEENPEALFSSELKEQPEEEGVVEESAEPEQPVEPEERVKEDILKKRSERLALLKKFGIKEPEDEFVEAILQSFKLPSEKELSAASRELKKEILSRLKESTKAEELDLYISPAKLHDTVELNIDVYVKPLTKEIEEKVKSTIERALKEKVSFPYQKGVTINAA